MPEYDKLYLCDGTRKLADGMCDGHGCMYADHLSFWDSYCYMTKDKKYRLTRDYWIYDPVFDKVMHGVDED